MAAHMTVPDIEVKNPADVTKLVSGPGLSIETAAGPFWLTLATIEVVNHVRALLDDVAVDLRIAARMAATQNAPAEAPAAVVSGVLDDGSDLPF